MANCKDCAHSVFDELWGEYKCLKGQHRIYILVSSENCPNYKKKDNEKKG